MVTTSMDDGKIYVFDYITNADSVNSGADQELDGKTEGSDYIEIDIPDILKEKMTQDGSHTIFYGGKSHLLKRDKIIGAVTIKGLLKGTSLYNTMSELKKVKRYISEHKDNNNKEYLFICFDYSGDIFYPFYDEDEDDQDYLKGWLEIIEPQYKLDDNFQVSIKLKFHYGWD